MTKYRSYKRASKNAKEALSYIHYAVLLFAFSLLIVLGLSCIYPEPKGGPTCFPGGGNVTKEHPCK